MANASVALIPTTTVTTATTITGDAYVFGNRTPEGVSFETIFAWGSGGTTAKTFIQTSLDGGLTWFDIANQAFTTAIASKVSAVSTAIAPGTQGVAATDGTLADNTVNNGVLGDRIRAKVITTGTYAGGTTIAVWASVRGTHR